MDAISIRVPANQATSFPASSLSSSLKHRSSSATPINAENDVQIFGHI
jgi:hypothetical protein